MTTFHVPGRPQGKGRPRFTRSGHTYTPDKTRVYQDLVQWLYKQSGGKKLDGAVWVEIFANFTPPKSDSKKERARKLAGDAPCTVKPDCDNIAKIILDALNGVAFADDNQVAHLSVSKYWREDNPGVHVYVAAWGEVVEDVHGMVKPKETED